MLATVVYVITSYIMNNIKFVFQPLYDDHDAWHEDPDSRSLWTPVGDHETEKAVDIHGD